MSDTGIDGREVLLLCPGNEGSSAEIADVRPLLEAGLPVGDVVLPRNKPRNIEQLGLFE